MPLSGQNTDTGTPVSVSGYLALGPDSVPLSGVEIELHRIAPDSAGIADRRLSDDAGRFRFDIPIETGTDRVEAVYLATARYEGVLYFGRALHALNAPIDDYVILAFGTERVEELPVHARRTVILRTPAGLSVEDAFAVRNDGARTLVAADGAEEGWRIRLPKGSGATAEPAGGMARADLEIDGDAIRVVGTVLPGGRTFVVRYELAGREVMLQNAHALTSQELLLASELSAATVEGLTPAGTATLDDVSYTRFSSTSPPTVVRVRIVAGSNRNRLYAWLSLAAGLTLSAAAIGAWRRASV